MVVSRANDPASIMAAANLSLNRAADVREEAGRIVIEPVREPAFDIDDLIAGITADNVHDSVDFGAPVGGEVW